MRTYRDLLTVLNSLSIDQLDSEIRLLSNNELIDSKLIIQINEHALYRFKDTNGAVFHDFEDDEISDEFICEKVLPNNYPIITLL